jgi:hypothetical protein
VVGDRISLIVKAYDAVGDDDEFAQYGVDDDAWNDDA